MKPSRFHAFLNSIADAGLDFLLNRHHKPEELLKRPIAQMCEELLSNRGEASGLALAREIAETYKKFTDEEQLQFFIYLESNFSAEFERVKEAAEKFLDDCTASTLETLKLAVESPRQELFRRFNLGPDGVQFLVRMREDLQRHLKATPSLRVVDKDLHHLFASWFNRGFLELRRIDWNTPAAILEKLINYEAVHEFRGWKDLRRRLAADRRCYGFFHPSWPDEPLIFVQVALVDGLADSITPLVDETSQVSNWRTADTAIFYSITNCQDGLRGVSFGNLLIKQVAGELSRELSNLTTFSTLSPVPGFAKWAQSDDSVTSSAAWLDAVAKPNWHEIEDEKEALRDPVMQACAEYLINAKRGPRPQDPVARFHLGNGARLERINWMANPSERGLAESFGIMVNYKYNMAEIIINHERFMTNGEIAYSAEVENLL